MIGGGCHAARVIVASTAKRAMAAAAMLIAALGCEAPQVVDCTMDGQFVEAGDDFWCVYPRLMTDPECPRLVPFEHDLPWGGKGCATREHSPLPPDLCVAVGRCAPDGGSP